MFNEILTTVTQHCFYLKKYAVYNLYLSFLGEKSWLGSLNREVKSPKPAIHPLPLRHHHNSSKLLE